MVIVSVPLEASKQHIFIRTNTSSGTDTTTINANFFKNEKNMRIDGNRISATRSIETAYFHKNKYF
jgi:hypothetical protein